MPNKLRSSSPRDDAADSPGPLDDGRTSSTTSPRTTAVDGDRGRAEQVRRGRHGGSGDDTVNVLVVTVPRDWLAVVDEVRLVCDELDGEFEFEPPARRPEHFAA